VPAIFILLALAVRDRRTLTVGGLAALGALVLYVADPTVHHHLALSTDSGSVGIRFQRLPPILQAVSHHPYLGLGLGGLSSIGVTTTDNFYLSAYGETGVVGAAILIAVCLTALVQGARGLLVTDRMRRAVIAASVLGFIAFLASGAFDDALLLGQPATLAMLLLAVATATAEPELGFAMLPRWSTPRAVFLTAMGALVGLFAFLVAPVIDSQERTFSTVNQAAVALNGGGGFGPALIGTVCDVAKAITPDLPDTTIDCRDNYTAPGIGTLRVESPSSGQTLAAYTMLTQRLQQTAYLGDFATFPIGPPVSARATAWDTAPVSGAVLGFALAFIAPLPIRRRRPTGTTRIPPDVEPPLAVVPPAPPRSLRRPPVAAEPPAADDTPPEPPEPVEPVRPEPLEPVRPEPVEPVRPAPPPGLRRPVEAGLSGTGLRPPRRVPARDRPRPAPAPAPVPTRHEPPAELEEPRPSIPALDP
jgi:hypothetical protein